MRVVRKASARAGARLAPKQSAGDIRESTLLSMCQKDYMKGCTFSSFGEVLRFFAASKYARRLRRLFDHTCRFAL